MNSDEKLDRLRGVLQPVIAWYEQVLRDGEPDGSFLYDMTAEQFDALLSRGDYQSVIEILRADPTEEKP